MHHSSVEFKNKLVFLKYNAKGNLNAIVFISEEDEDKMRLFDIEEQLHNEKNSNLETCSFYNGKSFVFKVKKYTKFFLFESNRPFRVSSQGFINRPFRADIVVSSFYHIEFNGKLSFQINVERCYVQDDNPKRIGYKYENTPEITCH